MPNSSWFIDFSSRVARAAGHPTAFMIAGLTVIVWAVSGPLFGFSDTWQLVINTGTTVVTFLMVFLIQSTQNRDAVAMQVKLDELIRAIAGAHNELLDLEELDDERLEETRKHYRDIAAKARADIAAQRPSTGAEDAGA